MSTLFKRVALAALCSLCVGAATVHAQTTPPTPPKQSEASKLEADRTANHTVKQVTPNPTKSPAKHADNLSKNVNHEMNRSSKHVNRTARKDTHALSHARHTDHTVRQTTVSPNKSPGVHANNVSKNVNHETNRESKDVNHTVSKDATALHNDRKTDHTVRQVTVDPKKSPAKHVDNLSKNVNHEADRVGKDVKHIFGGDKKKGE